MIKLRNGSIYIKLPVRGHTVPFTYQLQLKLCCAAGLVSVYKAAQNSGSGQIIWDTREIGTDHQRQLLEDCDIREEFESWKAVDKTWRMTSNSVILECKLKWIVGERDT